MGRIKRLETDISVDETILIPCYVYFPFHICSTKEWKDIYDLEDKRKRSAAKKKMLDSGYTNSLFKVLSKKGVRGAGERSDRYVCKNLKGTIKELTASQIAETSVGLYIDEILAEVPELKNIK
jgi:hypothetical protein